MQNRTWKSATVVRVGTCLLMLVFAGVASADLITLSPVASGFNSPIGVDYHQPTNSLILSSNYPSGSPHTFELVDTSGIHTQFSNVSGLTDEIYMASARSTANGFLAGETFTGNGQPGQILKLSPDGSTVTNPWVTLPGEGGLLRGALHIDTTGIWGGDLIVATTVGNVWRVNSSGVATFIGSAPGMIEGITTVPNDPLRYGAWAGKILAGSDGSALYTFDTTGALATYNLGFSSTENLQIPNAGETFYGVDFGGNTLWGADSSQWTPYVGDVIMGEENGNLWDIAWNGVSFDKTLLTHVSQWEGATFAPTILPGISGVPEPGSLVLLGTTVCGFALSRLRRGFKKS
jgi:hypothetical protein